MDRSPFNIIYGNRGRATRSILLVPLATITGTLGLFATGSAGASPRPLATNTAKLPAPSALISLMNKAIATMYSVHLNITAAQSSPKVNETISQDSGYTSGSQSVSTGNEHASVLLTPSNAYLSGNSTGLSAFFALPADDIPLVGTKWIVIKAGATQYKTFVNTIGYRSLFKNLVPTSKPLSISAVTYHSVKAYALHWQVKSGTSTTKLDLYLPQVGKELPIAETAVSGATVEQSVLSQWNKKIAVNAPTNTIAISKLHPT